MLRPMSSGAFAAVPLPQQFVMAGLLSRPSIDSEVVGLPETRARMDPRDKRPGMTNWWAELLRRDRLGRGLGAAQQAAG